ncbi:MAG: hypothetical protein IKP99_07345 [Bacteroidales bacterium]|nr:hypothetical protein [Bacteroidales bacterium]
MSLSKSLKDYIEKMWPEIIGISCSIITYSLSQDALNVLWAIFIIVFTLIACFFIRYFVSRKKSFFNEKTNHLMVYSIKQLREHEKDFPEGNNDCDKFAQTMVDICDSVCQTIIGEDREIDECTDYCVVVYLGVQTAPNRIEDFSPLYSDNSKMSESYINKYGGQIFSLKDNTSFNEVYNAYCKRSPHTPRIITTSNIKKKIQNGRFHSTLLANGVGYKQFPYNSSCVFPILPFHNDRKGNEMQGYVSIMSNRRCAFKDSGITNKDFNHYLESVSGILYDICIKDKSKDNKTK